MLKRYRVTVLVTELVLLFFVSSMVLAQSIQCTQIATLPPDLCAQAPKFDCDIRTQIDVADFSFILNADTGRLLVYSPQGSLDGQYNLPASILPLGYSSDFLPLSNRSILITRGKLYQFDLEGLKLTDITPPQLGPLDCSIHGAPGRVVELTRVGDSNSVLLCRVEYQPQPKYPSYRLFKLSIFDFKTHMLKDVAVAPDDGTNFNIPFTWADATAGQDGQIYQQYGNPTVAELTAIPNADWFSRYDPNTGNWTSWPIYPGPMLTFRRFLFADRAGNLYFQDWPTGKMGDGPTYTKVKPSGQRDWIVSSQELGGVSELMGIRSDNKLAFMSRPNYGNPAGIEICSIAQTSTVTPSK